MVNPIAFVKAHPVATGGIIIAAIVVFVVAGNIGGGGAAASSGGASTDDASAGAALQAAQIQAQAQAGAVASAERSKADDNATALAIAQINAQVQGQGIDATKDINLHQIDVQGNVTNTQNTLAAHAAEVASNNQLAATQSTNATIQQQSADLVKATQASHPAPGPFDWIGNIIPTILPFFF